MVWVLSSILLSVFLPCAVLASPHNLFARNDSGTAVITTTINFSLSNKTKSANDTLSPPTFRTLLYLTPPIAALPSLSGRQPNLEDVRYLHICRSPTAIFNHSYCLHNSGRPRAMQRYVTYCRERPTGRFIPPLRPETGVCAHNEICVNTVIGNPGNSVQLARCIKTRAFKALDSYPDDMDRSGQGGGQGRNQDAGRKDVGRESGDGSGHVGGEKRMRIGGGFILGGKQASVVVSGEDGQTPLGIERLEIDAATDADRTLMERSCRNCVELRTKRLDSDASQLNLEATLVTAGSGVAAGVFWVALLSG